MLWAIDPATNRVSLEVPLADVAEILALDVDGQEAWIALRRPGRIGMVIRVEIPGGRLLGEAPVALPAAVELSADRAWVTNYDGDEVLGFAR